MLVSLLRHVRYSLIFVYVFKAFPIQMKYLNNLPFSACLVEISYMYLRKWICSWKLVAYSTVKLYTSISKDKYSIKTHEWRLSLLKQQALDVAKLHMTTICRFRLILVAPCLFVVVVPSCSYKKRHKKEVVMLTFLCFVRQSTLLQLISTCSNRSEETWWSSFLINDLIIWIQTIVCMANRTLTTKLYLSGARIKHSNKAWPVNNLFYTACPYPVKWLGFLIPVWLQMHSAW